MKTKNTEFEIHKLTNSEGEEVTVHFKPCPGLSETDPTKIEEWTMLFPDKNFKYEPMKITTYEQATTLLRSKGYSIKIWTEGKTTNSLSVEDYSLSVNEHMEEIRELLGKGWIVNKLSNQGLITIDKK